MNSGWLSFFFKKQAGEEETGEMKFGLARVFKYQELKKATNSFATELGRGGYGKVYLGKLQDGQMVAVKVLFDRDPKQLEHFFNEVTVLSRARHKNLVSLCGCTNPTSPELLLVYEYVPNGTVAEHLHGQRSALDWGARIRIATEAAEALAYLHGIEPPIIHRDVKTSNILLDHNLHAKVADLGICRLLPWDTEHVSTLPQGTMGYRDPEYDNYLILTNKTDVYSFGVVLMELISGQQAVDVNRDPDDIYLDSMAIRKIGKNKLEELVDPNIGYHSNNDIRRMVNSVAELAAECLQPTGDRRPSMVEVVTVLKGIGRNELVSLSSKPQKELGNGGLDPLKEDKDNDVCATLIEVLYKEMPAIPFAELKRLTRNFGEDALIGEGPYYRVFKATLGTGKIVAIKKLGSNATQYNDALSKVNFLGSLSHPCFVELLGYCYQDEKLILGHCYQEEMLLLAYEFMEQGTLENHLFGRKALSWDVWLKIAIGAARGLTFLHSSKKQVIYRDFKPANIFLDRGFNAKLSDSRLATYGPTDELPYIEKEVIDPCGYEAPEYITTGRLYVKSDVYAFGLVLLEICSGKRAIDQSRPRGEHKLADWAKSILSDQPNKSPDADCWLELMYSSYAGPFSSFAGPHAAVLIHRLIERCLAEDPKNRPSMTKVVEDLMHIQATMKEEQKHRRGPDGS